jgi:heme exporter protein C
MWQRVLYFVLRPMPTVEKLTPFLAVGYATLAVCISMILTYTAWYVPCDKVQGDAFRLMYVHVPLAILSLAMYVVMGLSGVLYSVFHLKSADLCTQACAMMGFTATLLAIATGSIWAKPTWGTWWLWDARLTSECVLALMYIGYLWIRLTLKPVHYAKHYASLIAVMGTINVPIVHYSVEWWYTLHQGSTLFTSKHTIAWPLFWPLLCSLTTFIALFAWLVLHAMIVLNAKQGQERLRYGAESDYEVQKQHGVTP